MRKKRAKKEKRAKKPKEKREKERERKPQKRSNDLLLVLGLGNPGSAYSSTRHNVGFRVVDLLAHRRGIRLRKPFLRSFEVACSADVVLAKPLTYMNNSGTVVAPLLKRAGTDASSLLVVCDNMDLPTGDLRLKRRGNSRSHNGIASIVDAVGSGEFARLYVGIGRPEPGASVVEYVLSEPPAHEESSYNSALDQAVSAIEEILSGGIDATMNRLNSRR